ncbi:hypothetical protein Aduo_013307 [Ancylostoma duodenale]
MERADRGTRVFTLALYSSRSVAPCVAVAGDCGADAYRLWADRRRRPPKLATAVANIGDGGEADAYRLWADRRQRRKVLYSSRSIAPVSVESLADRSPSSKIWLTAVLSAVSQIRPEEPAQCTMQPL